MKRRMVVFSLTTLFAFVFVFSRASAVVTVVGGGAAAVDVHFTQNATGQNLGLQYGSGTVELPQPAGSATPIVTQTAGRTVGPLTFQVGRATTVGTLAGTPYAQSSAYVAGLQIPGVDIRAVQSECIWDVNGARASTTVVAANGRSYMPNPNMRVAFRGGYIVLNEQQTTTEPSGSQTIAVRGAHVFIYSQPLLGTAQPALLFDIGLALSDCDPGSLLPLPLNGLQFTG